MTLLHLCLSEWRRLPLRTSVTAAGVGIAVAGVFSLLAFHQGYKRGIQSEMGQLDVHVLVVPKGCPYDAASLALHGANWPCYLKSAYLSQVVAAPGVAVAAPVFMSAHYGPNNSRDVLVGVASNYLQLKRNWRITGAFPAGSSEV